MKIIAQAAEAVIKTDGEKVVKERIKKGYRIGEIDDELRKRRTRSEAKTISKINKLIPSPKIISYDDKSMTIEMEFIKGEKISDVLEKKDYKKLCRIIGKQVAILHNHNIVHGDLTTSNFILSDNKVYFIDFGLSQHSTKVEDKAVDLHLLRQALESKHYTIWEECFKSVLEAYKAEAKQGKETIKRLHIVEKRGRYKGKH